jgi:NADPH:quinone reductase-like Zn-dependent oxidoreductase
MMGDVIFSWTKYPFILGSDLAAEVVEVRKSVTRFKVGDRPCSRQGDYLVRLPVAYQFYRTLETEHLKIS